MIKNDYQFKIYFYNYLALVYLDPEVEIIDKYEECLKKYLMYHGYKSFIRDDNGAIKSYVYNDLNVLMEFYLKYGEI